MRFTYPLSLPHLWSCVIKVGIWNGDSESWSWMLSASRIKSKQCSVRKQLKEGKQTKVFEKEVNKNNQNKDFYNPLNQKAHSSSHWLACGGPQELCPPSLWEVPQFKILEKLSEWFKLARMTLPLCFLPPTLDHFLLHQAGSAQSKQNGQRLQIYIEQMRNQRKML